MIMDLMENKRKFTKNNKKIKKKTFKQVILSLMMASSLIDYNPQWRE